MTVASAPASSANLGPGYDVLAIALGLRCKVTAIPAFEWSVESGDQVASAATNKMVRLVAGDASPCSVQIDSNIPVARGLGSSAAVLVASAAAIRGVADRNRLFEVAAAAEGHSDNVAAAVFGGLVAVTPAGLVERLGVHPSLHVLVAVPDESLLTREARTAVSAEVPRDLAVRTASRLTMLVEGLRTGEARHLQAALGDELHEAPRSVLTPTPERLIAAALGAGALYAAWSGSGPSVISFSTEDELEPVLESLNSEIGPGGVVIEPEIDREGVRFE